jgi:opacity protein-like surface antigen
MRSGLTVLACAVGLSFPLTAYAQGECPPGSWFCDDEGAPAGTGEEEGDDGETAPEPGPTARGPKQAPPIVVYQPSGQPPDKVIVVEAPPPKPARKRWRREWGFNLHLESVLMGDDDKKHPDSGMGGLGFGFRYRPIPHFAFEAGVDFLGGIDWAGNDREERALLLNAIVFFNPKSKLQVYTIGGIGFSEAEVQRHELVTYQNNTQGMQDWVDNYSYFGAQLGLGLEWRVSRKVALDLDVIGFIRGRTDEQARFQPEFTDPDTGRVTNTSGGGLARLGITFYW